jgi:hypothetical protein
LARNAHSVAGKREPNVQNAQDSRAVAALKHVARKIQQLSAKNPFNPQYVTQSLLKFGGPHR